jgi:hypothetical protein
MDYSIDDINYEDMDDLALPDHIEWNHNQSEEFSLDAMDTLFGE